MLLLDMMGLCCTGNIQFATQIGFTIACACVYVLFRLLLQSLAFLRSQTSG